MSMTVRLTSRTRVRDGGRLLVGGSPTTVQRLRRPVGTATEVDAGSALGRRWLATGIGTPVLGGVDPVPVADLTVVVPAHGRPEALARCLEALRPLAVVVVDDASEPPLAGATVTLARNAGPAAARNAGLARVSTRFVAFVDSDLAVRSDALLALARHLADPEVAVVAPRVRGHAAGHRWWERYDVAFSSLDLGPHPAPVRPGSAVAYLPSACLVARTAVVRDECGGFDPELRVGEDVDLVWRLVAGGHRVRYDPTVVARHDVRGTAAGWLGRKVAYGASAAPLAARHGAAVAPAALGPAYAVAAAGLLLRRRWSVPVAAVAVGVTARSLARTVPPATAVALATEGLGWAVRQQATLLLRHWWPATVALVCAPTTSTISNAVRRAATTALVVDSVCAATERRGLALVTLLAGRRLDDLAYGAGLWWGCLRARSARALLPRGLRAGTGRATVRSR